MRYLARPWSDFLATMEKPDLTIAICTYNRSEALEGSVGSCFEQQTSFPFEVLVVDNNSTDNTQQVLAQLRERYAELRCVKEPKQGLSHARNRALHEAKGEIVAFIDDDCVVLPGWLEAIVRGFEDPSVGAVGGITHVGYPDDHKPEWLTSAMEGILGLSDRGPEEKEVSEVMGGNMAFRRDLALRIDGFAVDLGYAGTHRIGGEDCEISHRVTAAGYRILHLPDAKVIHCVDRARLDRKWIIGRHRLNGAFRGRVHRDVLSARKIAEEYLKASLLTVVWRVIGKTRRSLEWAMTKSFTLGMLDEFCGGQGRWSRRAFLLASAAPGAVWRIARRSASGKSGIDWREQ